MLFLDSLFIEVIIFLATSLVFYYVHFRRNVATYWEKKGIPHLQAKFLLGNSSSMGVTRSIGSMMHEYYKEHRDKKVLGMWSFHIPMLVIFDREIVKNILSRDFSSFHDRMTMEIGDHDFLAKENLFSLNGHAWRNMRVKLSPAFSTGKIKMMYPTICDCGDELREYLKKFVDAGDPFDVKEIFGRFTMNVIASCAFGIEINALHIPDSEFCVRGKEFIDPPMSTIFQSLITNLMPRVSKFFKLSQTPKGSNEFFLNIVKDTMDYRKKNNIQRKDFMQLLIELVEKGKIEDVDKEMKKEEIDETITERDTDFTMTQAAAQAFLFFIAGFETSSLLMTYCFYELALNQDIQKKLKDEIKSAMKKENGVLSYEGILKLEYLEWVIQETLRKYPTVPAFFRETTKDYYLAEFEVTIPKKTLCLISTMGMARDPDIYPDPEKFDPTRFSPERRDEIPPYAHIPFGEGPRICIGMRFGMLQAKVGICSVLGSYRVETCEDTPKTLVHGAKGIILTIVGGMPLKIFSD